MNQDVLIVGVMCFVVPLAVIAMIGIIAIVMNDERWM